MTDKMLRIVAKLHVKIKAKVESPLGHSIRKGDSASIFFKDRYFPSKTMECPNPIEVGEEGEVVFWMIDSADQPSGLASDDFFDLKRGPNVTVATGRTISISEIP